MDIFKNSKDIVELTQLIKALIEAHNGLHDNVHSLTLANNKTVEEVNKRLIQLEQHITHLNKELGIEAHIPN